MAPLAYFITFATYGTWLHGDGRGSVDRNHNTIGTVLLTPDGELEQAREALMSEPEYRMQGDDRRAVLTAIIRHAEFRGWVLRAAHVRTNHVHIVVAGDAAPERRMTEFKAYATRALKRMRPNDGGQRYWSRHGSTRWLNTEDSVRRAIEYAVDEQGEPMAVYHAQIDSPS